MWQACFYNEKAFQIEYNILLFLNSHLTCHRLRDYPTTRYLNCQCIINDVLNLYFCWHYCCMKAALLYWLIPDARESVACYTYIYIYILYWKTIHFHGIERKYFPENMLISYNVMINGLVTLRFSLISD